MHSIKYHKQSDSRINLFTQFLGQSKEPLPMNVFQIYLSAIDASGYIVQDIFSKEAGKFEIPFFMFKSFITRILLKKEKYIYLMAIEEVKPVLKVKTPILSIK